MLPKLTDGQFEAIYQRAKRGEPIKKLAQEVGICTTALSRRLKRRYGFTSTGLRCSQLSLPADPTVLGYIAGLMDGEGYIRTLSDSRCYISIGVTNEPVIRWLGAFGGKVYRYERPAGYQTVFTWRVHRQRDSAALLQAVLPYLIVKRERAQGALAEMERHFGRN